MNAGSFKLWAKTLLNRKPGMLEAARQLLFRLGGTVYRNELEWLARVFNGRRGVVFLQIGANDGMSDDSIYPFVQANDWRGVLVEPVGHLFDRLVANYAGAEGLAFEKKALLEKDGKVTFYRLKETTDPMPGWYDQIGSLKLDVILSHRSSIPNIADYLVEEEVEGVCFTTLMASHGLKSVDLILIDTEGYDLNILRTIDFQRFRPELIIYEDKHLSIPDKARAAALLRSYGYVVHPIGANNAATLSAIWNLPYWRHRLSVSASTRSI